jgi:periplasmic protein TonB
MKAFSSVASITVHVGVVAAVLFGTAKSGRSDPVRPIEREIFFQPAAPVTGGDAGGLSVPGPITVAPPDFGTISVPMTLPKTGGPMPIFSPTYSGGQPGGLGALLTDEHADVLSGPLPVYPDLLRQAGIEGKVVLEAVVDTTGRALAQSIAVVTASNPGFIAPARQALLATLFRPAMVGGKPVRMLVRIPYEFAIRNGTGRAR